MVMVMVIDKNYKFLKMLLIYKKEINYIDVLEVFNYDYNPVIINYIKNAAVGEINNCFDLLTSDIIKAKNFGLLKLFLEKFYHTKQNQNNNNHISNVDLYNILTNQNLICDFLLYFKKIQFSLFNSVLFKYITNITYLDLNYLSVNIINEKLIFLFKYLKNSSFFLFKYLIDLVIIDNINFKLNYRFKLMYNLFSIYYNFRLFINMFVNETEPVYSITEIYGNSN